jgi:diketogulonate reductase-like aldo/keto reductase
VVQAVKDALAAGYRHIVTSETISFLKAQMFYGPERRKRVERV